MWIIFVVASIIALFAGLLIFAHCYVNDVSVPSYKSKIKLAKGDKIVYIVAHPDDEVLMSGTIATWQKKYNISVSAIYLTHGEDGPTGGLVEKCDLKQRRLAELQDVSKVLKLDNMVVLDYPDRYLNQQNINDVTAKVADIVEQWKPRYIISFDRAIGMYGHPDHIVAGVVAKSIAKTADTVEGLIEMTLPLNMIKLAMKVSKTFRERFSKDEKLPLANIQCNFYARRMVRRAVTDCHKTQWQVMAELQPLYNKIPPVIYYAIFSKEYYHYTAKQQLDQ